jgi:translation initiation factor 1
MAAKDEIQTPARVAAIGSEDAGSREHAHMVLRRLRHGRSLTHDPVMADRHARTVYSTDAGRVCPGCGWPVRDCKCSTNSPEETIPKRIVAKLRVEKSGRSGKTVTVVAGLPRNAAFLKTLGQELKRACGTGGTVLEDSVELQGDLRDRIRSVLQEKGYSVKG